MVYNKPTTAKVTPSSSTPTPTATAKGVMPKTGVNDNPWIAYAGGAVIALALGTAGIYYYKKNKATEE